MEERTTYYEIKHWNLELIFDSCRSRLGHNIDWSYAGIISEGYNDYEANFELPIEKLMLAVVCLILTGGWYPNLVDYFTKQAINILLENSLDNLLLNVPLEEANEFLQDLRILKLID
ncbi:hypothetical protein BGI30_06500 [Snodgrassella alvi]|jgi:hypothetical protein|uniref:hypothetical protein n=1 Tax=Snodgrassella alvi TaxID=1196083 RepID=UPI000C1E79AC|nr:hypothetical protein [Snodgrassella alvi]PIT09795.1 hypothetical protein BGI30_06500 [Snodgrassella alvi]PIT54839.1 hypothetical protein BHC59_12040 [Snodgrassella alvi]